MRSKPKPLDAEVLIIDDEPHVRLTLRLFLETLGCRVHEAAGGPAVRAALSARSFDVVLLDVRLEGESGLDLLPSLMAQAPAPYVAVVSAFANVELAVRAARSGARACLCKPYEPDDVQQIVANALAERAVADKIEALRRGLDEDPPELDLQTVSPRMLRTLDIVARVAPHATPVLLHGAVGTGKAKLARRLHALSVRAGGPFVVARGAALSPDELARAIAASAGGTLFLDEIAELPVPLQASVQRLIAEQRYRPPGEPPRPSPSPAGARKGEGERERDSDVRVVATSSERLDGAVAAGRFAAELREQLRPFEVLVPSLRDRREDILPLARRLLVYYSRHQPLAAPELSLAAEQALVAYEWPGNLRELGQAMERAAVLRLGTRIELETLPDAVRAERVPYLGGEFSLADIEREHILRVLATATTKEEASRILGIDVSTLWRKRKRYRGPGD